MKLTFWYEFMLRLTHNEKKIRVIPKVGYRHLIGREGSLYSIYASTIDKDESEWWYETAKKECSHTTDRKKQYKKEEKEK